MAGILDCACSRLGKSPEALGDFLSKQSSMSSFPAFNLQVPHKELKYKGACTARVGTQSRHQMFQTKSEVGKEPQSLRSILTLPLLHRNLTSLLGCP